MIKVRVHYEMQDWEKENKTGYIDLDIYEKYEGLANGSLYGMPKVLSIVENIAKLQNYDEKRCYIAKIEKNC